MVMRFCFMSSGKGMCPSSTAALTISAMCSGCSDNHSAATPASNSIFDDGILQQRIILCSTVWRRMGANQSSEKAVVTPTLTAAPRQQLLDYEQPSAALEKFSRHMDQNLLRPLYTVAACRQHPRFAQLSSTLHDSDVDSATTTFNSLSPRVKTEVQLAMERILKSVFCV